MKLSAGLIAKDWRREKPGGNFASFCKLMRHMRPDSPLESGKTENTRQGNVLSEKARNFFPSLG